MVNFIEIDVVELMRDCDNSITNMTLATDTIRAVQQITNHHQKMYRASKNKGDLVANGKTYQHAAEMLPIDGAAIFFKTGPEIMFTITPYKEVQKRLLEK